VDPEYDLSIGKILLQVYHINKLLKICRENGLTLKPMLRFPTVPFSSKQLN